MELTPQKKLFFFTNNYFLFIHNMEELLVLHIYRYGGTIGTYSLSTKTEHISKVKKKHVMDSGYIKFKKDKSNGTKRNSGQFCSYVILLNKVST